tara:strand:- start:838 stop:1104 length:267 start_codon:yes stop_codon:yes gene_type:complete
MKLYHHNDRGMWALGPHKNIINTENIVGCCDGLRGNAQNLTGDVAGIYGTVTGLSGDATNVTLYVSIAYLYVGEVSAMRLNIPIAEVL